MKSQDFKLKATPNYSKRTFTIRKTYSDGQITKYRTPVLSKDEFENELNNTENDWFNFLKYSACYYLIN